MGVLGKTQGSSANNPWLILVFGLILFSSFSTIAQNAFAQTETIAAVITGSDFFPLAVAVNPNNNMIYATDPGANNQLDIVNGTTNTIVGTLPTGNQPFGVAVNPNTDRIFVTNRNDGTMTVIDGQEKTVMKTITLPGYPQGIAVDPNSNKVYVAGVKGSTGSVFVYNANNGKLTTVIGSYCGAWAVAVNPVTSKVYVTSAFSTGCAPNNMVYVIDENSNTIVSSFQAGPAGLYAYDVQVNPATNRIYVSTFGGSSEGIYVADGSTNGIIAYVQATEPRGIAVNPTTDKVYVTNLNDGTLSIIDGQTNTLLGVIPPCQPGPPFTCMPDLSQYAVANPKTNMIYVGTGSATGMIVINGNP